MAIETEPICWLDVPGADEVPDEVKELWASRSRSSASSPTSSASTRSGRGTSSSGTSFYDELMRGESGLTKAQREMIAVVVSTANRCHYCIVSHSAALRKLTGDPILVEQLQTNHAYAKVEPKERAMLDFALKLTERSSTCTEADVEALREAGWSDEDVMDIAEVAAMFNFTNRLASGLGWRPNPEYVSLGR